MCAIIALMRGKVRNPTVIPSANSEGRKLYYDIDVNDPPSIPAISLAWQQNVRARDVGGAHGFYPLLYVLKQVKAGNFLRHGPGDPYFESLVEDVRNNGIKEPIMVEVDRFGNVALGEGHHRLAALLTICRPYHRGGVLVPVRFWFREREYHPRNPGTQPTWITFMRPSAFWKDDEVKRKKNKRERRAERERADREARVRKIKQLEPAKEADVTMEEKRKREIEELIDMLGIKQ